MSGEAVLAGVIHAFYDVAALPGALAASTPVRLLDVRWRLDRPEGRPAYLSGHLPGAVYVDLERELADPGHPEAGRHPVPSLDDLQSAARRWGLRNGDIVVAYDDNDGVAAARAWWLLRHRGVDIRVLDGGLQEWARSGELLERGDVAPELGNVTLTQSDAGEASIDDAARAPHLGVLLDVRSPHHYRGGAPAVDPVSGHIPGAINLPTIIHLDSGGRLRSPDEIVGLLASIGHTDEPIVVYCSSGIASAHTALALATAGIHAKVYPGSWSQWARSPGRAVAVGSTPDNQIQGGWRSEHIGAR
jgi:thiosulfate/3-mercaptopyruvate sulfurtransferase